jgi:hypothetical protein
VSDELRPAAFCAMLLRALDVSDGRRSRRKRSTTADALGLSMKRDLLQRAAALDPAPADFEAALLQLAMDRGGGALAMAREIFDEHRLAQASPAFRAWLESGAPSEDAS